MSTTVYTIYKHNLYLEILVTSCKSHESLSHYRPGAEKNTEMFYDSTMIGSADCSLFIP